MARSVPAFLQSAGITVLAVCEGITFRLYSFPHTRYHLPLLSSPAS